MVKLIGKRKPIPGAQRAVGVGFSANYEESGLLLNMGGPPTERRTVSPDLISRVEGRRVFIPTLDGGWYLADGVYNGWAARIMAIRRGRLKLLAETTVAATKVDLTRVLTEAYVTDTTFQWGFRNFHRPGADYFFRVIPVDGSNAKGTPSAWLTVTASNSLIENPEASNPTETAGVLVEGGTLTAPTGLASSLSGTNNELLTLTWNAVSGATGYAVEISWQDPTKNVEEGYIEFADDCPALSEGVFLLLQKQQLTSPDPDLYSNRVYGDFSPIKGVLSQYFNLEATGAGVGGEWKPFTDLDPAPSGIHADYYVRVPAAAANSNAFRAFFHSGLGQTFYPVFDPAKTYKVVLTYRAETSFGFSVKVEDTKLDGVLGPKSLTAATTWTTSTLDLTVDAFLASGDARTFELDLSSLPGWLDICQIMIYEDRAEPEDFPPQHTLPAPTGGTRPFIRDHTLVKFGGYSTPSGNQYFVPGYASTRKGSTIYTHMRRCQIHNANPWIGFEWVNSPEDFVALVDYLAGPASDAATNPAIAKRVAMGQSAPWTDVWPDYAIIEPGNEWWNFTSGFQTMFSATDYDTGVGYSQTEVATLWARYCFEMMSGSTYWPSLRPKLRYFVGGRANNVTWAEAAQTGGADDTGIASYNGGWDEEQSNDVSLDSAGPTYRSQLLVARSEKLARYQAHTTALGDDILHYEDGSGYGIDGLNGTVLSAQGALDQLQIKRCINAATSHLHSACLSAVNGNRMLNFFCLEEGNFFDVGLYGRVDPAYAIIREIWDYLGNCTVIELNTDQSATITQDGVTYPAVVAYRMTSVSDPNKHIVAVMNLDIDPSLLEPGDALYSATSSGNYAVAVNTGLSSLPGVEYMNIGENFRHHQVFEPGVRLMADGSTVVDSNCVRFAYDWQTAATPNNPNSVPLTSDYGCTGNTLKAGCHVLLKVTSGNLFIPSGSDSLITSDGNTFKVTEA